MNNDEIIEIFNYYIKEPKCSLNYNKDYELLIATVLSAQCTDERVNKVTKVLFDKYDLEGLAKADVNDIIDIIRPCGNMNRKGEYIKIIANRLITEQNGVIPHDREYIESLPGVGRKVCNVILANIFHDNIIAVDTHVERVSKRLGFASINDNPLKVEQKLNKRFKENLGDLHHQILLFGRHYCKAKNPLCDDCKFKTICKYKK
jgi:endonuclease-3